jgi:threonine/homoserine/homoserine lactone efflux protein
MLIALPGPTILLIVTSSATGRGPASVLGSTAAVAAVAALIASGLYERLLAVPYAADVLALFGAITVARIGWKLIRSAPSASADVSAPALPRTAFIDALTTTLLNPKIGIAFPAFVASEARGSGAELSTLAWLFAAAALAVYFAVSAATGIVGRRTTLSTRASTMLRRAAGVALFALAARIAWPTLRSFS